MKSKNAKRKKQWKSIPNLEKSKRLQVEKVRKFMRGKMKNCYWGGENSSQVITKESAAQKPKNPSSQKEKKEVGSQNVTMEN